MPTTGQSFPTGGIIMWSGAIANIPQGWFLCNGSNGTPNLTDRFVIHADADSGGSNNVGATGGAKTVTLTSAQSGIPAHTHTVQAGRTAGGSNNIEAGQNLLNDSNKTTLANVAANASSAHTNRDKYYALAYIMKT